MHNFVSFNFEIVNFLEARIGALAAAALYGKGIFTTIAIYNGRPFLWEKHWRRLADNSEKLGLDISEISSESVQTSLQDLIEANMLDTGRARITLFDERSTDIWPSKTGRTTSILISTGNIREYSDEVRLTISPFPINSASPLVGIKSCNYLENLAAFDDARNRGFQEAVRLNERGEVASACVANLFWLRNGRLFTPSLVTGCLAGTTREFILENLECEEVKVGEIELHSAEAVFICSAGVGIAQATSLGDKGFEPGDHEVLHLLPVVRPDKKTRTSAK